MQKLLWFKSPSSVDILKLKSSWKIRQISHEYQAIAWLIIWIFFFQIAN